MLRTNDLPVGDADAIYQDVAARQALLATGTLPTSPAALACAETAVPGEEIYDTARLRLIFYDNPFWGPYRFRLARIFSQPRYLDLRANLRHFQTVYAAAAEHAGGASGAKFSAERARFQIRYDDHITRQAAAVSRLLSQTAAAAP